VGEACSTRGSVGNRKFWSENPKEREHAGDVGVEGRIMLEFILGK
jgi:hypothetical protein